MNAPELGAAPVLPPPDEGETAAVAESDADPRTVPHGRVRLWLLRLAAWEFDAPPPEPDRAVQGQARDTGRR